MAAADMTVQSTASSLVPSLQQISVPTKVPLKLPILAQHDISMIGCATPSHIRPISDAGRITSIRMLAERLTDFRTCKEEKRNTCLHRYRCSRERSAGMAAQHLDGQRDAELMICSFVRVSADPAKMTGSRLALTRRD